MAEEQTDDIFVRLAKRIYNPIENLGDFEAAPKIFKHVLTFEQAQLADAFPGVPEELALKVGRDLESVNNDLQYMYRIGVGTPSARSGKWNLPRTPMLFMDKLCTHHRNFSGPDFKDLLQDLSEARYQHRLRLREKDKSIRFPEEIQGNRLIPAYTAVKDKPELQPWESMKSILQISDKITVVDCPCRIRTKGNRNCQMPNTTEACFLLNRDAEYAVDSGAANNFLTVDEAMIIVERMEKVGMIHNAANLRGVSSLLCNCCIDHCMYITRWHREGKPRYAHRHPSRYLAVVNNELCVGCGSCVERCFLDAISRKRDERGLLKAVVDEQDCMGCGSCVVGCPHAAIEFECVRPEEWVPSGIAKRPEEVRTGARYEKYANL
ncbi:4Fe-4S binding protein [Thermodesulfobacteriota bacterium]